ncbi:MAG: T9SS type A sorting domain-containing protein [Saprospiraceae bacterium]|nr:T9SS type A sorting domain-containing protein [Saprospiraceae bacterium]
MKSNKQNLQNRIAIRYLQVCLLCLFALPHLTSQINVGVTVLSGTSTTTCTDPFDPADPGWSIRVENEEWVQYFGTGSCPFPVLPNLQYQAAYDWQGVIPATVKVCFEAYEHDPNLIIVVCSNRQCIAQTCLDLAIPALGQSADYTITLPDGLPSAGSAQVRVTTGGSPVGPGVGVCSYTQTFGIVETDINRGYKMLETPEGDFVIAGQWNGEAYLMKTDNQGNQLAYRAYGAEIGGVSNFLDVEHAPGGGYVVAGECTHCTEADTTVKVMVLKINGDFEPDANAPIHKFGKADGGPFATNGQRYSPALAAAPDGYLLASTAGVGGALNAEDLVLTKLSFALDSLWSEFHLLGFFERAGDVAFTGDGYAITVNRAFSDLLFVLKADLNGEASWSKIINANALQSIEYIESAQQLTIAGSRATDTQQLDVLLYRLDATTGDTIDSLIFGEALNDVGVDLHLLDDGNLLLAAHVTQPNDFGIYLTSRIYRIQADPLLVVDYDLIPNPDDITNMGVESVLPLSCNGNYFASTGIRGFNNRTFFHSIRACGNVITASATVLCEGESIVLTALEQGDSYLWSTGETTQSITVSAGGTYSVSVNYGCLVEMGSVELTQIPIPQTNLAASICEGDTYVLPDGSTATTSGVYPVTLTGQAGCDSVITTTLSVFGSDYVEIDTMLCSGQTYQLPNGEITGETGIYTYVFTNQLGCDSTVTVLVAVTGPVVITNATITPDNGSGNGAISVSVTGGVNVYQYQWSNGANSSNITGLTAGSYTLTVTEGYGCSWVFSFDVPFMTNVDEAAQANLLRVYPNPFTGQITVETIGRLIGDSAEIRLHDLTGKVLLRQALTNRRQTLETGDLPLGYYGLEYWSNGSRVAVEKLLKMK